MRDCQVGPAVSTVLRPLLPRLRGSTLLRQVPDRPVPLSSSVPEGYVLGLRTVRHERRADSPHPHHDGRDAALLGSSPVEFGFRRHRPFRWSNPVVRRPLRVTASLSPHCYGRVSSAPYIPTWIAISMSPGRCGGRELACRLAVGVVYGRYAVLLHEIGETCFPSPPSVWPAV